MLPLALPFTLLAAQAMEDRPAGDLPAWVKVSGESVAMPQPGERLGLLGITLGIGGGQGPYLAPSLYGAVRGRRGGLLALGFEGGWRQRLNDALSIQGGLFLGGGGGGGAPVGSGLMTRVHLGLGWEVDARTQLGAAWSEVRWPGGEIRGRQAALSLERRFRTFHGAPETSGSPVSWDLSAQAFQATFQSYRQRGGLPRTTPGLRMNRSVGLAGVAWTRSAGSRGFLQAETSAAAQGEAAGYMEVLAGGGLSVPLGGRLEARVALTAGSGGGGGLDTGGGFLLKAGAELGLHLGRSFTATAAYGLLRAPSSALTARTVALKTGFRGRFAVPGAAHSSEPLVGQAWRLKPLWSHLTTSRRQAPDQDGRSFDLIGLQGDWLLQEHLYLLGQGAFACSNGAGAYATGFLGAGFQTSGSAGGHRLVLELRAGAGGGAGLETGGGALVQPMAGWLWEGHSAWGAQLLGGRVQSLRGGFRSPVFEAALVFRGRGLREP